MNTEKELDDIVSEALSTVNAEPVDLKEFEINKVAQQAAALSKKVKEKPVRSRSNLPSSDDFKETWDNSESVDEVAEHFGISKTQASAKASQLRSKGHVLKQFKRGRKKGQTTTGLVTKATLEKQVQVLSNALIELGEDPEEILKSL